MISLRKSVIALVALGFVLCTGPVYATVFSLWSSDAKYSHKVSGAAVTVGGVITMTGGGLAPGVAIAAGGVVLSLADPDPATFFTGGFQHRYDSNLFEVVDFGWLGDWGKDPSLEAPPVDDSTWPGLEVVLQGPNGGMSATVSDAVGIVDVSFDWGIDGYYLATGEPINIFGVLLQAKHLLVVDELMTVAASESFSSAASAERSLSVVGSSLTCRVDGDTQIRDCSGDETTVYFFRVAEPGTLPLFACALGALPLLRRMQKAKMGTDHH
jgi:hypothetical protein